MQPSHNWLSWKKNVLGQKIYTNLQSSAWMCERWLNLRGIFTLGPILKTNHFWKSSLKSTIFTLDWYQYFILKLTSTPWNWSLKRSQKLGNPHLRRSRDRIFVHERHSRSWRKKISPWVMNGNIPIPPHHGFAGMVKIKILPQVVKPRVVGFVFRHKC